MNPTFAFALKTLCSGALIAFASWLAEKRPALAGFILALPISSLLAIALVQGEWQDAEKSVTFARSILVSVPLSLSFFLPFLFSRWLRLPFWGLYASGLLLLGLSYGLHRWIFPETGAGP